jgi:nucleotide-binding universal stress UspA family protein
VVGQTNPAEMSDAIMDDFPEYMVLNSGRPTLIVPYAGEFSNIGQRPVVAWDGSRAAARAVTDALPFLKLAESVSIAMFNSKLSAGEQVGAELVAFLGRHDIQAEVIAKKTKLDIGNALLSLAADCDADMLVMGGYGHSRLREMIMGGVTRRILESMTLPVLMSH